MLSTRKGAPNNIDVQTYFEGHQYEIHGELLDVFLKEGWCEAAEPFREGANNGETANTAAAPGGDPIGLLGSTVAVVSEAGGLQGASTPGEASAGGEGEKSEGKEPELVLAEADVLSSRFTRDELLDLAEEQEIEVPANLTKKADVVKFLAGKLKVTVE
jgi:hypothetical protein